MFRSAVLVVVVAAAGAAAQANRATSADPRAAMLAVRTSPAYTGHFEQIAAGYEKGVQPTCNGLMMHWGRAIAVPYGPLEASPTGGVRSGTWVETVPGTACGHDRQYRAFVHVEGGNGGMQALLPGNGYAGPLLESDAAKYVGPLAAATLKDKSCKPATLNTEQVEPDHEQHGTEPWHEVWTVSACGKLLAMRFTFKPDPDPNTGTSIQISTSDVRVLGPAK